MACRSPFSRSRLRWRGLRRQTDSTAQFSIVAAARHPTTATRPPLTASHRSTIARDRSAGLPEIARDARLALHRPTATRIARSLPLPRRLIQTSPSCSPRQSSGDNETSPASPRHSGAPRRHRPHRCTSRSATPGDNSLLRVGNPKIRVVSSVDQKNQLFCSSPLSTSSSPLATAATGTPGPKSAERSCFSNAEPLPKFCFWPKSS